MMTQRKLSRERRRTNADKRVRRLVMSRARRGLEGITVKKWIDGDADYPESIGGLGGWFGLDTVNGGGRIRHRWADYLDAWHEHAHPRLEALRGEIVANKIRVAGDEHQSDGGTPLFSDLTVASFSMRGWGDLMAAIWSTEEDKDYCYMDFYMRDWL